MSRQQINLKLSPNDRRDSIIIQRLATVDNVSQFVKSVLHDYIQGLLIDTRPVLVFHVLLHGVHKSNPQTITKPDWKVRAVDAHHASLRALSFATLNSPEYTWRVMSVRAVEFA